MNRLPNPFRDEPGQQPKPQHKVDSPGFLMLSPPTGNNNFTTLHGSGSNSPRNNSFNTGGDFIPFGNNKNDFSRRGNHRGGARGSGNNHSPMHHTPGGFSGGGGGNNRSPMHHTPGGFSGGGNGNNRSPMHHTPGGFSGGGSRGTIGGGRNDFRMGNFNNSYQQSPYNQQGQNYSQSPGHHNIRGQRHGFSNTPNNRNNQQFGNNRGKFNSNGRNGGHGGKGPLSDVPIDKFVSFDMVNDPWRELEGLKEVAGDSRKLTFSSSSNRESVSGLDDSEIVIDTDTSAFVDNSYNNGAPDAGADSGTEGDSSPVHDTGSDSPYNIATSSTSEKDTGTGSDSEPFVDTYGEFV
ncbi:unnamed protein product [Meganyctiphanes norvegica]|uniref:Uncharacterized protein n=1 Tax=Meganyctiphanes norvegica TaxID=48144 RepID=A0AAV2SK06_MEGNR